MQSWEQVQAWLAQALAAGEGGLPGRVLAVLGIVLAAWLAGRLLRAAVLRLAAARRLDERLQNPGFGALLAQIAQGLVWLFALPALLDALNLQGLLAPVNAMMSRLLGFVPNLMGAAVAFGVGFLVAQVLRQLVSGLALAAGSEKLAQRIGLGPALGERTLAGLLGSLVFALVLLPTLAAALQSLGIEAVAQPVSQLLEQVIGLIPRLVSAAVIVVLAVILGRVLAGVVAALCVGLGLNRLPARIGLGERWRLAGRDPAEWVGTVVMATVVFVGVTQASEVLGFAILTRAVATLGLVLANLLVGAVVLAVGGWLAVLAARAVQARGGRHAAWVAQAVRAALLFFAAALALQQAGLPAGIVMLAFGAVVGSIALGLALGVALALGLGGRAVAQRLLERALAPAAEAAAGTPPQTPPQTPPPGPPSAGGRP